LRSLVQRCDPSKTGLIKNNEEINKLLEDMRAAYIGWQNDMNSPSKKDRFKHLQRKAQRELCTTQDTWWDLKADEVKHFVRILTTPRRFSAH